MDMTYSTKSFWHKYRWLAWLNVLAGLRSRPFNFENLIIANVGLPKENELHVLLKETSQALHGTEWNFYYTQNFWVELGYIYRNCTPLWIDHWRAVHCIYTSLQVFYPPAHPWSLILVQSWDCIDKYEQRKLQR